MSSPHPVESVVLDVDTHAEHLDLRTLGDILTDPDALREPEPVVPGLAWSDRVTMLAAREKTGKSTLLRATAAAVSQGMRFAGERCTRGGVLYLALEDHLGDLARGLVAFGAHPELTSVMARLDHPFDDLEAAIERTIPAVVIVDTLAAFVESWEPASGAAEEWTPLMRRFTSIARESGAAIVLAHHANKAGDGYRDSTAIGANVDMIATMTEGEVHATRHLKYRGRWSVPHVTLRLVEEDGDRPAYFERADAPLSLDTRILAYVERHPGASQRDVERAVSGRAGDIRSAVSTMLRSGVIRDDGDAASGRRLVAGARNLDNPHGHATDAPRTHPGRTPGAEVRPEGGGVCNTPPSDAPPTDAQDDLDGLLGGSP